MLPRVAALLQLFTYVQGAERGQGAAVPYFQFATTQGPKRSALSLGPADGVLWFITLLCSSQAG